jgi:hypothetical protein
MLALEGDKLTLNVVCDRIKALSTKGKVNVNAVADRGGVAHLWRITGIPSEGAV